MTINITVITAQQSDKKNIKRFYKNNHYAASYMGYDSCYIIKIDNNIVASVIVSYIVNENSQALLHALFVDESYRKNKLASLLIQKAQQEHSSIVCFAHKKLIGFYQKLDFIPIETFQTKEAQLLSSTNLAKLSQYQRYNTQLTAYIYHK